jgi:hypothetical protein
MSANLIQNIPLLSRTALSMTTATTWLSPQVGITDTDFDGVTSINLEVVATNANSTAVDLVLVYWNGSAWADVDTTNAKVTVPGSVANATRIRSGTSFNLISGNHQYTFRNAAASSAVVAYEFRIIITQVNATKTAFYVPLGGAVTSSTNTSDTAYGAAIDAVYNGSVTTFTFQNSVRSSLFYFDANAYGNTLGTASLQVVRSVQNASYAGNDRLYNVTDGQAVVTLGSNTQTAITFSETTLTGQTYWASGKQYRIEHSCAGATTARTNNLWQALIVIRVTNLTKGEVYWRVAKSDSTTSAYYREHLRVKLDHASYSNPVLYHEVTGACNENTALECAVYDHGTNDAGTTNPTLLDAVVWNSATKTRYRSASLPLPTSGDRFIHYNAATTNADTYASQFLVVAFTSAVTRELALAGEAVSGVSVAASKTDATWELALTGEAVSTVAASGTKTAAAVTHELALAGESRSAASATGSVTHATWELSLASESGSAVSATGSVTHAMWDLALASEAASRASVTGSVVHATWDLALASEAVSAVVATGTMTGAAVTHELALSSESVSAVVVTGTETITWPTGGWLITTDTHMVSSDSEEGVAGETHPTEGGNWASYIAANVKPVGWVDFGDERNTQGVYNADGCQDEWTNYVSSIQNHLPHSTVGGHGTVNATWARLPGNHDEDYPSSAAPPSDFSAFETTFWSAPFHWTADWTEAKIRFIGFHTHIRHNGSVDGIVETDEIDWLEYELQNLPSGWSAVPCSHIGYDSTFTRTIPGGASESECHGDALRTMLAKYTDRIAWCASGHDHTDNVHHVENGLVHISHAALAYTAAEPENGGWTLATYDSASDSVTLHLYDGPPGPYEPSSVNPAITVYISRVGKPEPKIVVDGLVAEFAGSLANGGTAPGSGSLATWTDTAFGAVHDDLTVTSPAWVGNGSSGNPYALQFNGTSTSGVGPSSVDISPLMANDHPGTLEAWVYFPTAPTTTTNILGFPLDYRRGLGMYCRSTSGNLGYFRSTDSTSAYNYGGDVQPTAGWRHCVVSYEGSGVCNIYIDGVGDSATLLTSSQPAAGTTPQVVIGNRGASTYLQSGYKIATARVYDRALTPAEVAQNYNAGILATSKNRILEMALSSEAQSAMAASGTRTSAVTTHELVLTSEANSAVSVNGSVTHATWELALANETVSTVTVTGGVTHATWALALASESVSSVAATGSITHATWELSLSSEAVSTATATGSVTHATWALALASESVSAVSASGQKQGAQTRELAVMSEAKSAVTATGSVVHATWDLALASEATSAASVSGSVVHATWELSLASESKSAVAINGSVTHATWDMGLASESRSSVSASGKVAHATWDLALSSESASRVSATGAVIHAVWNLALAGEAVSAVSATGRRTLAPVTHELALANETFSAVGAAATITHATWELVLSSEAVSSVSVAVSVTGGHLHQWHIVFGDPEILWSAGNPNASWTMQLAEPHFAAGDAEIPLKLGAPETTWRIE